MFHSIAAFLAAALLAFLLAAALRPRLMEDLGRPHFWAVLAGMASLGSAVSAFVAQRDHAGTGFVIRHGWPKPFWFDFVSEAGERETAFEPLYFAGNALFYAALLLTGWTFRRIVSSRAAS